ncbi:MAG: PAS domain S-box protein [Methylobacter sp.]|nr:PAS domain S-box protein [Methylobacter sp.]
MNKALPEDFASLRNRLLNDTLLWISLAIIPGVALSLARVLIIGWKPLFLVHLVLLAALWLLWLGRNRVIYHLRVFGLLTVAWLATFAGLIQLGPVAFGGLNAILFAFIAILFLSARVAGWLIAGNTLCLMLFGWAASRHWIEFSVDYQVYVYHPLVWANAIWTMTAYAVILALIGSRMVQSLLERETLARKLAVRQQKIAANVPGIIYQFLYSRNGSTRFPYVSEGSHRVLGIDPEQLMAESSIVFSLIHPGDIVRIRESIQISRRDLTPCYESLRIVRPQQGVIWVEINSTPERLTNGDTLWHGYIRDITALKIAEQRLSASLENTPHVAVQWYDQDGRVQYWNPASEQLFGWTAAEASGKTLDRLIQSEQQARYFHSILAWININKKAVGPIEYISQHRDGREVITSSTIFSIPNEGTPLFVCMDVDITERKQAEAALKQAKLDAEFASLAKSEFLTNMSHELRTPLNAIIGFSQLLEMGELMSADTQKEAVGHIMNSGRHLLNLINEILDLARIESGKPDFKIETTALLPLIDKTVALSLPAATPRNIVIKYSCPSEMHLSADMSRVRQVLLNLLSNAIKYNRQGGSVALSCYVVNDYVRVTVADTGIGLAKECQSEIFQPFNRLGAENSNIEGTGIGLVICKRLIEGMGGRIGFDSTLDVGSRFWFELPHALSDREIVMEAFIKAKDETSDEPLSTQKCVLYIEDSTVNIAVMKHMFRTHPDIKLLTAESAESGLAMIREARPDLVLMDINLPGMSGLEALHALKSNPNTSSIPVIAVSAAAMPDDIEAGLKAGFLAYLTKPFNVSELIALIRKTFKNPSPAGSGMLEMKHTANLQEHALPVSPVPMTAKEHNDINP